MTPDAKGMARIHAAAFVKERPWSVDEFESLCADPLVNVFGNARCFLVARCVAGEAEILTLATDPAHQGQGHARIVLANFLNEMTNLDIDSVFLEVAADNQAAISLYSNAGFSSVGTRRGYYQRAKGIKIDALVLRFSLNSKLT